MPAIPHPQATPADPRHEEVRARDRNADGRFVHAVATTGIYCRPSCSSRRARPENLSLHPTPAAAEAAGFRPCRRCRPDRPTDPAPAWLAAVVAHLDRHVDRPVTLEALATIAKVSPCHLQRRFKAMLGVSPKQYHAARRLHAFKAELRSGESVLGAGIGAGYGSTSRAHGAIDEGLGMTPSAYRAGGAGERISYAIGTSALGPMMMAATDRGVCLVEFGADEAVLVERLAREFPRAERLPASPHARPALDGWMRALDDHLARAAPLPDVPLDLRGTAFQMRVWRFLLAVPQGRVVSYGELARGIGSPAAVRAAASACGANRVAVLVPCHRALRGDGLLGGYRWGLERKRALLARERAADADLIEPAPNQNPASALERLD